MGQPVKKHDAGISAIHRAGDRFTLDGTVLDHAADRIISAFDQLPYDVLYFCYMHMDGFMDCNDAIMSRRPLEERQRILKDSTVGAFAVVTVAFLLLAWFAAMSTAIYRISYADLLTLPVVSRAISGLAVLVYQPIGHSQYVEDYKAPGRWKYRLSVLLQTGLVMGLSVLLGAGWIKMLICSAVIAVVGFIACLYARKQLGGMSGDIAGYTICIGELAGIFALAVL